jgi:hypothetical protein
MEEVSVTAVLEAVNATSARDSVIVLPPDPALSAWERGSRVVSREELLRAARAKLTRLTFLRAGWDGHRAMPTEVIATQVLNAVLVRVVRDDQPTPQIAPLADGGVQVEWLVEGRSVEIEVSPDGEVVVLAQQPDEPEYLIDAEFGFRRPDLSVIDHARDLLNTMASLLRVRDVTA